MVEHPAYIDVEIGSLFYPLPANPNKLGTLYLPIIYVHGLPVHYVEMSDNKPSKDSVNLARVAIESFKKHDGKCSIIPVSEFVEDKFSTTKEVSSPSYYDSQLIDFSLSYINEKTTIGRHTYSSDHSMVTFNAGTQKEITFSIWDLELMKQIERKFKVYINYNNHFHENSTMEHF